MKKIIAALLLMASATANAYLVGTEDVGGLDTLLATTTQASIGSASIASETDWVNDVLSPTTLTFHFREDPVDYFSTDVAGVYAFKMLAPDDYFLVKNSTHYALFQNNASLDWGVFDTALLDSGFNLGNGSATISHVTSFNGDGGTDTNVPEPGSLALLAIGLGGLTLARKKAKKV